MKRANKKYIPALKFNFLSSLFDFFLAVTMPEQKIKLSLLQQTRLHSGEKVLDFGCGTGTLVIMAKKLCPEIELSGIDVDKKILRIAEKKIDRQKLNINLLNYDGSYLPFTDASFAKVVSSLVFHHLTSEQKKLAFQELFRVLAPGGEIHIADFGKGKNKFMQALFFLIRSLDGLNNTRDNAKGLIPNYLTAAGLVDARETGYFNTAFGTVCLYSARKEG